MVIIDYYYSLDEKKRVKFRDVVLDATGWSYPTFYAKFQRGHFTKSETFLIEHIIKKFDHA